MEGESMEKGLLKKPMNKNYIKMDGDDEIDDLGGSSVTQLLVFSVFVAVLASFSYGCATGFSSVAEAGIMEDLGLSTAQYSIFGSIMTLGSMIGAILSGKLADLMGRKRALLLMDIFFVIGWFAIIFAKAAWWLYLGRLSLGFAGGLQSYLSPVYVAEIAPKNLRGGMTGTIQLMFGVGLSLVFFIGNVIAWRTLALIGALPCVVHVLGLFFIPESPRWLAKIGQEKQSEETLQRLRSANADVTQEATEIRESTETLDQLPRSRLLNMFEKKYALLLTVVLGIMAIIPFGGSMGVLTYASSIFELAGSSSSLGNTAIAIIQIPLCMLSVYLMEKWGRRPLLLVSLIGTLVGNFVAGSAFLLQDSNQWRELTSTLVIFGVLINLSSFAMGAGIPWVVMAEILPLNIKGSAGSLAIFVNMLCVWIVSYFFNFLLEWSSSGMFFIFAIISGSAILFVAKLLPETKGRTLEEIESSMLI